MSRIIRLKKSQINLTRELNMEPMINDKKVA